MLKISEVDGVEDLGPDAPTRFRFARQRDEKPGQVIARKEGAREGKRHDRAALESRGNGRTPEARPCAPDHREQQPAHEAEARGLAATTNPHRFFVVDPGERRRCRA